MKDENSSLIQLYKYFQLHFNFNFALITEYILHKTHFFFSFFNDL